MRSTRLPDLPVLNALPDIKKALSSGNQLILQAPPGAGKTTVVPLALLDEPWLRGKKIIILEPRRLAAKAAANRMARILGEETGQTVGYKIRLEKKVSPNTRVEVVTEGILTRYLQNDPSLEGAGAVIFDEFHERSLHGDLGLALALESQEGLREDLRICVMSATLNSRAVLTVMPASRVVDSPGKSYPVDTRYVGLPGDRIERTMAQTILRALGEETGDILAFLPGYGEIRRTSELLEESLRQRGGEPVIVAPLYGALSAQEQQTALVPADNRKVVLATSIAETSLTIEGIRVVIDSGLMRVPRFDPGSGMNRLETLTVSRDSADQRRGRAGRLGPGACYRLWNEGIRLIEHRSPGMLQTDLTSFVLELALWGAASPDSLGFIDAPPAGAYKACREVLQQLDAVSPGGEITERGREMAAMPVHPRLAHGILESRERGCGYTACLLASLLSEGDILRGVGASPDITLRLEILDKLERNIRVYNDNVSPGACRRILSGAAALARQTGISHPGIDTARAGEIVAFAYPDRIGRRKSPGVYQLVNGKQVRLPGGEHTITTEYLAAARLGGNTPTVFLAAPYGLELLKEQFGRHIREEVDVTYIPGRKKCSARRLQMLGRLMLKESPAQHVDSVLLAGAVTDYICKEGLRVLPWDKKSSGLRQRMAFMYRVCGPEGKWPDVSDEALLTSPGKWLGPWISSGTLVINMSEVLLNLLTREQQKLLARAAPTHITVPSGSHIPVDYSDPSAPVLAVRLQEMFGLAETPCLGDGRVNVTLHLLSPARRPVQITQDLAGFWRNTYKDVKKDLLGRYPKHYWPDDPSAARATNRTKKNM